MTTDTVRSFERLVTIWKFDAA